MKPLVNELLSAGFNVQLLHDTMETSWEDLKDHGYVSLRDQEGKELARRDGFQHNRKLRSGGAWDGSAVKDLVEEITKAFAAA